MEFIKSCDELSFEGEFNDIDTTRYLPADWARDPRLPVVEDTRYVGVPDLNPDPNDNPTEQSRRQGTTLIDIGPDYARSGQNGTKTDQNR